MTRIELDEASGPVSPRFQYSLSIVIDAEITIRSKNGPLGTLDTKKPVTPAQIDELHKLLAPLEDLVDQARSQRVGIRVNSLDVDGRVIRYLASDVNGDDPTPAQSALRLARTAILDLAR